MQELNGIIQVATATLLGLVCVLLVKHSRGGLHTWTGIGFALSIVCYVVIESRTIQAWEVLRIVATVGAICIPVLFWLLSRAIFDDHFRFTVSLFIWFIIIIIPHFDFFLSGLILGSGFEQLSSIIGRLTSLGFVLAGLYTMRLVGGHVATGIEWSAWLLVFSMFIFLSLALAKRYSEMGTMLKAGRTVAAGRGYRTDDMPVIQSMGVSSGYLAVLVS